MTFLALAPATRDARLAAAAGRFDAILAARPDLQPAVALQKQLIGLVVDLTDEVEHGRLPRLSLPAKYVAAKLARGLPALAGEPIPLPVALLTPTFLRLCEELAKGGAGKAAEHIRSAIEEAKLDLGSLLAASLARDGKAIRPGAVHRGLSPDLLWLLAELAVSPVAHALQNALLTPASDDAVLAAALAGWDHGYCPACSSWPALVEVTSSRRVLQCSFCAFARTPTRCSCVYCGEDGDQFLTVTPSEERRNRRIEFCGACRGYLKNVDVVALSPFPLLAIADLETIDLDVVAMQRGYSRPPLKEFPARPGA